MGAVVELGGFPSTRLVLEYVVAYGRDVGQVYLQPRMCSRVSSVLLRITSVHLEGVTIGGHTIQLTTGRKALQGNQAQRRARHCGFCRCPSGNRNRSWIELHGAHGLHFSKKGTYKG